jgi:hypothetical protein
VEPGVTTKRQLPTVILGDPWTDEQRRLADIVFRVWLDSDPARWPYFAYVEQEMYLRQADARKILASFPTVGVEIPLSLRYADVLYSRDLMATSETRVQLSVAGLSKTWVQQPRPLRSKQAFHGGINLRSDPRRDQHLSNQPPLGLESHSRKCQSRGGHLGFHRQRYERPVIHITTIKAWNWQGPHVLVEVTWVVFSTSLKRANRHGEGVRIQNGYQIPRLIETRPTPIEFMIDHGLGVGDNRCSHVHTALRVHDSISRRRELASQSSLIVQPIV